MHKILQLAIPVILAVFASHAHAEGDVTEGERLAREICARCHNVEPDGPFKLFPPSFASIAVYRPAEDIRWKIIAPPLHTDMPQLSYFYLAPDNIGHLVAYITSLETQ